MIYNIVCHDGKTFEINDKQKEAFYKLSGSSAKGVDINGEFIFFSSVGRIEKVRGDDLKALPELTGTIKEMTPDRKKRALNNIVKGFKKHFTGREMPVKSQEMLKHFIHKIG